MELQTTRPRMPAEYGVPRDDRELLPWSHVSRRMRAAKHYWLATVTPAGAPHCRPIAGMWVDDRLYFGGSADSRIKSVRTAQMSMNTRYFSAVWSR